MPKRLFSLLTSLLLPVCCIAQQNIFIGPSVGGGANLTEVIPLSPGSRSLPFSV
ncbi:MAG: hypothetical protein M3Q97_07530 [Bacteroidota bacterium]|nr:hypothetical protein [Bacteroidota bacterium]